MEMMYNELSASPLSPNDVIADAKMLRFIKTFNVARENGFTKIRFEQQLYQIEISAGRSIHNWLDTTTNRNLKELLLGAVLHPFIALEDDEELAEYFSHHFHFEDAANGLPRTECLGLAAAHLYDTLAISFSGSPIWEKNMLTISKTNDTTHVTTQEQVPNVFSVECFEDPGIVTAIENFGEVALVESPLTRAAKQIHFRADHGNDVLTAFANRLLHSPYVVGVINSLEWKSQEIRFIRKKFPNGIIELRLYWDDRGIGMVIQTTGRNQRETDAIAEILEAEYGN